MPQLMQSPKRLSVLALLPIAAVITSLSANAAALLLNFGPTLSTGTDRLLDPAHYTGIVPASELTWNRITADTNTLYYGDGTLATGVTLNLGRSTAVGPVGNDIINFNDDGYTVNALGTAINTGVYAGTSPVKDGIFGGAGGTNNLALGLRVDGLPAGTYRIVVHGRNSNTAGIASLLWYATNGASATTYAFTTNDATGFQLNSTPAITTGFVDGDAITILIVTISSGQSLYVASEGTILGTEMRGFFNAISISPGTADLPAKITAQPTGRSVAETATAAFVADGWGSPAVFKQWRLNTTNILADGPNIIGAHSNRLTLLNITPAMAGNYSLLVSNYLGTDVSSNGTLTVTPVLNTEQMSNIWNLLPGDRPYINTASTERGIAFNSLTTNLLLASRTPSNQIVVLDPLTGADKYQMNLSGVTDGTLPLNQVGVGDDGVVYVANLTTSATSPSYKIYRWADDSPSTTSVPVFIGDPGLGVQPNLRWGDNLGVRGAGTNTQILIAPGSGTNVVLLRTVSGLDFQTEIAPAVIAVSGVPAGFGAITLGVAFGPGTNTFWAKNSGGTLFLIQFDLTSNTASVIQNYSSSLVSASVRGIGVHPTQKFLGGIAVESPNDNARIYDVSNLTTGPVLRDQEAFATQNSNPNGTAAVAFGTNLVFALDSNNGIKAFAINTNYVPPSVSIVTHPTALTVMEGATATFSATAASSQPVVYQWRFNGTNLSSGGNISGANTNTLVISNVGSNRAGSYSLFASNAFGTATSSNGLLTVLPTFNTAQMTNIWNLQPGQRNYLGTNTSTERGLAYNSATTNLLLVSRLPADPALVVLDALTGAEKNFMDTAGIPPTVAGVSLGLNTVGAADDGVVFGGSVTVNASTTPLFIYRWDSDAAAAARTTAFDGDPMASLQPGLGYGDSMAVRGSGTNTQILLPPRSGTNVVLLRTSSGLDFKNEIPPAVIAVSNVPSAFGQLGVAFGPGTNTFWAKTVNNALYLIQFDLSTDPGTGVVLQVYSNSVPANLRAISVNSSQKFLAGIALDAWANVRLYDISDLTSGPILRDQEVFATSNPNVTVGGTGATTFGGNYVFALDSNNGIKAFLINTNFVPPLSPFLITSVARSGGSVVLTWASSSGRTYQVQSRDLLSGTWGNLGSPITATGSATSFTNAISSDTRFYRVSGQ